MPKNYEYALFLYHNGRLSREDLVRCADQCAPEYSEEARLLTSIDDLEQA